MEKATLGFHMYKTLQILNRFAGSFIKYKPLISEECTYTILWYLLGCLPNSAGPKIYSKLLQAHFFETMKKFRAVKPLKNTN